MHKNIHFERILVSISLLLYTTHTTHMSLMLCTHAHTPQTQSYRGGLGRGRALLEIKTDTQITSHRLLFPHG